MFERLIFEQTFKKAGTLDPTIWNVEVGEKWANAELQAYVNDPQTCWIDQGVLHLQAIRTQGASKPYWSARVNTKDKAMWQYGRFIVRAKLPKGVGAWPAIWFLPFDIGPVRWPLCGEIDLVELVGRKPEQVHFSLHSASYNHTLNNHRTYVADIKGVQDGFHDYQMDWDERSIAFFVDGKLQVRFEKKPSDTEKEWPFDKRYYLILNVAVGGTWGGKVIDADLPFLMQVQSIKVYR